MNALTYDLRTAAASAKTAGTAKPAKGFWARFYDALVEARMRQAEREIRMHLHLVPQDVLKQNGYAANYKAAEKLPFVK
jgi:hypothetical protein